MNLETYIPVPLSVLADPLTENRTNTHMIDSWRPTSTETTSMFSDAMDLITSHTSYGHEPTRILLTTVVLFLGYRLLLMVYNISPLHPLSGIPGPKLAAATYLPEFYYDVICGGKYTTKIREMHEKYGRINKL